MVVLLATFWQAAFSDWWDDQLREWQSYIQEDVNLSLLYSVANLAQLDTAQDPQARLQLARKISEGTARTVGEAIAQGTSDATRRRTVKPRCFST